MVLNLTKGQVHTVRLMLDWVCKNPGIPFTDGIDIDVGDVYDIEQVRDKLDKLISTIDLRGGMSVD